MTIDAFLAVFLGFSAICYLLLGLRVIGGIRDAGSVPLGGVFLLIGCWVMGGAVELLATSYVVFSIGHMGYWIGTSLIPVMLLICFRQYTGVETSRLSTVALLIVPLCSMIIAATNFWHELMWSPPAVNAMGEFLTVPRSWGAWFLYVHAPYSYAIVALSILTLLMQSTAVAPSHRRGLLVLSGASLVPIIACAANDLGYGSFRWCLPACCRYTRG